ncbi:hypothetical protein MTO96_037160 [Rhipicephalus appendiculatus]
MEVATASRLTDSNGMEVRQRGAFVSPLMPRSRKRRQPAALSYEYEINRTVIAHRPNFHISFESRREKCDVGRDFGARDVERNGVGLEGAPADSGSSHPAAKIGDEELGSKHSSQSKPSGTAGIADVSTPIDSTAGKEAQLLDDLQSAEESEDHHATVAEEEGNSFKKVFWILVGTLQALFKALKGHPLRPAIHEESVVGKVQDAAPPAQSRTDDPNEGDVQKRDDGGDSASDGLTPKPILCYQGEGAMLIEPDHLRALRRHANDNGPPAWCTSTRPSLSLNVVDPEPVSIKAQQPLLRNGQV